MIRNLKKILSKRFSIHNEKILQEEIEDELIRNNIEYIREYRLSNKSIIDFYFPKEKIGMEIKIKGSVFKIFEQVERYAEFDEISEIILASSKFVNLPKEIKNKKAYFISLSEAFL
jgi:hypothetical protein